MRIKIQGGLGNQLFQYAYGRSQELAGKKVVFDTSFFTGNKARIDTARNFKLSNYNIETKAIFSDKKHSIIDFFNKVKEYIGFKQESFYQSEKYFINIKDEVRQEFTLKNPLSKEAQDWQDKIRNTQKSISLHIRRGDYVQNDKTKAFHGTCDLDYYKKALDIITEKIGGDIEIFIFSDDINWTKENLKYPYPTNFVSDPNILDYEELYLMSLCQHNIIANSTFSWWAAWLNQNNSKTVVAPKQWFAHKTSDELGILPANWIRI